MTGLELGPGMNEALKRMEGGEDPDRIEAEMGNLLEDEKAGKTAHIAFGNNENMPGGKNNSETHRDFLFHTPALTVTYFDGSQREISV